MECAVCYCNQANCKLICKHSFCRGCVKEWYLSATEEPSCPLCRHRLYFKGMYKLVKEWEEESFHKKNEEAFAEAFDYIVNEESEDEEDESESESEADSDIEEGSWSESDWEEVPSDFQWIYPTTEEEQTIPVIQDLITNSASDSEESESESESESEFSTFNEDYRMLDLKEVQERFRLLYEAGYDIETELLVNDYYKIFNNCEHYWYEDVFNFDGELFVSKHQGVQNGIRRCSARVQGKRDQVGSSIDFAVVLVCV